jgi:hypothetical protein
MKNVTPKKLINTLATSAAILMTTTVAAQQISIGQRSNLVMRGAVQLVVNNAAMTNNGSFAAGNGTVVFAGHADTSVVKLNGSNATTFNNLTVNKVGNGIKLRSQANVTNTLTLSAGTLFTDSNLTLKSTAAQTARVAAVANGATVVGKANVERYIPSKRAWRLMTAPVSNSSSIFNTWQNRSVYEAGVGMFVTGANAGTANGLDVSVQNTASMRRWNAATQAFNNVTNTYNAISEGAGNSAANTGYFVFVRGDRHTNNLNNTVNSSVTTLVSNGHLQTGNQTFAAATNAGAVTLIGNPYAAPVNFSQLNRTNLINRIYVWDPSLNNLGGYVMLDDINNTGNYTKSVLASNMTQAIQSGQAFFVQTAATGAASITFTEASKTTGSNNMAFRPTSGSSQMLRAELLLNNNDSTILADAMFAEFNDGYSDSVLLEDAAKFVNINENIALVRNGSTLAAERRALATTDTLFIRIWKTTARKYQLRFSGSNLDGVTMELVDSYLQTTTPLTAGNNNSYNYEITADAASANQNRFMVVLKKIMTVLPVTITQVNATAQQNNIAVNWKVENELNMLKYEVEKSTTGTQFTAAATIVVNGNFNTQNSYNWTDVNVAQGNNFYRIKTIDKNGEVKYSAVVKVVMGTCKSGISIYPNPVTNNNINLHLSNQPKGNYQLKLSNQMGQAIYSTNTVANSSNGSFAIQVPVQLIPGIYNLEINNPNGQKETKMVYVK